MFGMITTKIWIIDSKLRKIKQIFWRLEWHIYIYTSENKDGLPQQAWVQHLVNLI